MKEGRLYARGLMNWLGCTRARLLPPDKISRCGAVGYHGSVYPWCFRCMNDAHFGPQSLSIRDQYLPWATWRPRVADQEKFAARFQEGLRASWELQSLGRRRFRV